MDLSSQDDEHVRATLTMRYPDDGAMMEFHNGGFGVLQKCVQVLWEAIEKYV